MTADESGPTPQQGRPDNVNTTFESTGEGTTSAVLAAALAYAEQGIAVFPLRYAINAEGEKANVRPIASWRNASTVDARMIRRWFGSGGSWEGAALAIDCGKSGLVVADLDVAKGKSGPQEWAALDAPATFRALTPSGGEHWYYREERRHAVGIDSSGKVAPGVDVRGLGGFVIAPPTVDARGRYAWTEGEPEWKSLPTVPGVVVERMTRRPEPAPAPEVAAPAPTPAATGEPRTREQAERIIARALADLAQAQNGTRNHALNVAACIVGHYVPAVLPYEEAAHRLTTAAKEIGLDEREAQATAASGLRKGMSEPASIVAAAPTVDPVEALLARMLDRDALDSIPAPTPLIRDVIDLESESWIIGAPGGFKSFVALDWACHVATGLPWRGKEVTQGRVVYVAAEGKKGIPLRVKAWEATYGERAEGVLFLPEPVQVADAAAWAVLVEACRRVEPVLIVLDTQARITVGLDENSNGAMSVLTEAVRKLKEATGACVLVVHHTGRNGEDARGASAIDGAQDTEIRVDRPTAKAKRQALTATISMDKQKDGDESTRFEVQLSVVDLGTDAATGRPLSSLALMRWDPFFVGPKVEPDWRANCTANQADVMDALTEHSDESGATRAQVLTWIKERRAEHDVPPMKPTSFDSAVKGLVEKGLIFRQGARIVLAEYADE